MTAPKLTKCKLCGEAGGHTISCAWRPLTRPSKLTGAQRATYEVVQRGDWWVIVERPTGRYVGPECTTREFAERVKASAERLAGRKAVGK